MYLRGNIWWTYINGKQLSLETANKRQAELLEGKLKTLAFEGKHFEKLPGERITVAEMLERLIEETVAKKAEGSVKTYRSFKKHLVPFFGPMKLTEVRPQHIVEYKRQRLVTGIRPATLNREISCLSKAFALAVREWEWVRENPCSRVSRERENNKRIRWLRGEEEARLMETCAEEIKDIVVFAIHTGMRMDEILSLKWEEVSLSAKTATVSKSKNYEARTIPLDDEAMAVLRDRHRQRAIHVLHVFPSSTGTKLDGNNLRKIFRKALDDAGIKDFRFHDLRHTYGTRLAQAGVDIYTIAKLMGHKDIATTMRYLHHTVDSLRANLERAMARAR